MIVDPSIGGISRSVFVSFDAEMYFDYTPPRGLRGRVLQHASTGARVAVRPFETAVAEATMKKIRLQVDVLQVESFAPLAAPEPRTRGTVRGAADTIVRSCQTEQYDCTAQGGYTCDYGSCVSFPRC